MLRWSMFSLNRARALFNLSSVAMDRNKQDTDFFYLVSQGISVF